MRAFLGRFLPFLVFGLSILGFILHKSIGTSSSLVPFPFPSFPPSSLCSSAAHPVSPPSFLPPSGTQLAMFFISFFIALLEAPWVYALFPPCYRVRDK